MENFQRILVHVHIKIAVMRKIWFTGTSPVIWYKDWVFAPVKSGWLGSCLQSEVAYNVSAGA